MPSKNTADLGLGQLWRVVVIGFPLAERVGYFCRAHQDSILFGAGVWNPSLVYQESAINSRDHSSIASPTRMRPPLDPTP